MRIVELVLDEDQENTGIEAISIVDNPAIEADFIALKAEEVRLAEVSKEKRILMGALLIPNKPIYRMSEDGEYYIYFSKETVEKASQMYLRNGNQNNATLEHQHQLQGLTLVESWIIEDEVHDKSKKYGLNLPVGTWMGSMKVESDDVWADLKKKGGFSIEGYFADKMQKLKTIKPKMNKEQKEAEVLLSKIISIVKGERVDLGLIQDIEADILKANQGAIKGIDMIEAAKKPLEASLKENRGLFKKIQGTKKSAIELGAMEILKKVQGFEKQVQENIKSIDKTLSNIY
jgi:hypothetical protein|tara:strand:+ start:150 stop:1016 length:867 start_codon:yes stop_codon:yes gene_type:complete